MPPGEFIGRQLGDFRIVERIGEGAMATVYRAYQSSVNRDVALKIIRLDQTMEHNMDEFQRRFAQEAEMIARLEHIHILPVYGYGIEEDIAYLAMRWLRGGTLSDRLRNGPLPLDQTGRLFEQIAHGLGYAHSKGVIHRDLKPSNIMLDDTGNAYLTDFGLAKLVEGSADLTKSGNIVGTPAYMAPEQLRGEPLDARADIYSLGVILYHMVCGRLPFDVASSDIVTVIYQHLEKPPPPPRQIDPTIPHEVETVILHALNKNREERFNSAGEMAAALNLALGRPGSTGSYPALRPSKLRIVHRQRQQRRFAAIGVGILLLALAALAVLAATRPRPIMPATVLAGEVGTAADMVPSTDEITMARQRLGSGFIAYIACNQTSEWHTVQARETRELATQYGLPFTLYDSETDDYRQITLIERARADGAAAIILCPLKPELLVDSLTDVQEAGIPLVIKSGSMPSYGGVLIAGDEYLMGLKPGQLAGQIIADEMGGEADVIILDYPDLPAIVTRANGLEEGVLEFAPNAHIVGRFLGATRENGEATVRQLIEDDVQFDVIVSINDAGSFGAIAAMEDAGFEPDSVVITSVDAEALAQQYIRDGYFMRGSVALDRDAFARASINALVRLLAGSTVPEIVGVPPEDVVTRETLLESGG